MPSFNFKSSLVGRGRRGRNKSKSNWLLLLGFFVDWLLFLKQSYYIWYNTELLLVLNETSSGIHVMVREAGISPFWACNKLLFSWASLCFTNQLAAATASEQSCHQYHLHRPRPALLAPCSLIAQSHDKPAPRMFPKLLPKRGSIFNITTPQKACVF